MRGCLGAYGAGRVGLVELWWNLSQVLNPQDGGHGSSIASTPGNRQVGPLDLTDVTVRQALDAIVRDHGRAAWIVQVTADRLRTESGAYGMWSFVDYDNYVRYPVSVPLSAYAERIRQRVLSPED